MFGKNLRIVSTSVKTILLLTQCPSKYAKCCEQREAGFAKNKRNSFLINVLCYSGNVLLWLYTSWGMLNRWRFKSVDLTPASVHDINYLKEIIAQMADITLLGDRGYLSAEIQLDLFNSLNVKLQTPMR